MTLLSIRDSRAFDGTSQIAHPQPITRTWHKTEPTNKCYTWRTCICYPDVRLWIGYIDSFKKIYMDKKNNALAVFRIF